MQFPLVSLSDVNINDDLQLRDSIAFVVSPIDERSPLLSAFPIVDSTAPQVDIIDPSDRLESHTLQ